MPELRRAIEAGGGLRTLYLIEDLDEVEGEALWADAKLGFDLGVKHRDAWVRSAIVTDVNWMARATKMFAWMMPGEARVFPRAQLEECEGVGGGSCRAGLVHCSSCSSSQFRDVDGVARVEDRAVEAWAAVRS